VGVLILGISYYLQFCLSHFYYSLSHSPFLYLYLYLFLSLFFIFFIIIFTFGLIYKCPCLGNVFLRVRVIFTFFEYIHGRLAFVCLYRYKNLLWYIIIFLFNYVFIIWLIKNHFIWDRLSRNPLSFLIINIFKPHSLLLRRVASFLLD